jgi:hypothetical protein
MPRHSTLPATLPATLLVLATSVASLAPALAQQQPPPRPCAAIRQVCLQAGFVMNGARAGDGLIVDCIRPIMQGTPQPGRPSKPLPAVDPALVEACRAQNPSFGMRNAQAPQAMPPRNAPGQPPQSAPGQPPQAAPGPSQDEPPPGPPAAPGQAPQEPPPPH